MKWHRTKHRKPIHGDLVIAAMWRPEHDDYTYWIVTYDKRGGWLENGDGEDMERITRYEILYWAEIEEAPFPAKLP